MSASFKGSVLPSAFISTVKILTILTLPVLAGALSLVHFFLDPSDFFWAGVLLLVWVVIFAIAARVSYLRDLKK